ncbi:hypothetical protein [Rhodoligotrophos ferricapiens]|uniref:hypothetical protein n=1 Tax=Rhodoligotrophos ferricapiens TaxID=3069264 RepID=UPI00315C5D67
MRKAVGLAVVVFALSNGWASAQLMDDERYALQSYCGDAIEEYCPGVDADNVDSLWECLAPHFDKINPMCKVTLQEIQEE